MSSAALQSAHQPAAISTLNTPSPAAGSSNHQYTPGQSPSRDDRYASRENANSPPSSSKLPSRRPSGNGASATSPIPTYPDQQAQSSSMTSRTALASPVPVAGSPAEYERSSSNRRRNEPPVAPPRTSSTQQTSSGVANPRRAARAEERAANSPRRTGDGSSRSGANGQADPARATYDDPSSRSRRPASQHLAQEPVQRPSSNRDHRQTVTTTMPVRSATNASAKQPSREASEVLNRVIVSQPEDDIEREQERLNEAQAHSARRVTDDDSQAIIPANDLPEETRRGGRSRHDHSKREKGSKFGDYYLGNVIGEGEFGKVKLGWKQDGGVQVAIKLIRRDSVGNNPSRLAKIYREVAILRGISHPNIVRLHEMSETERHIGIVLEYASGGELFDYILNHRFLKDGPARRLFAQLISGVGYLHKKGIVHRDLKLENLLLDRNRNIIITDFGFANTFDPNDELTEEEELNLSDRDFVKRIGLDKTKPNGMRRGDLMQTSCGSPCYAAPELVVSDSLYTGRKVDVWSCGVILYAMLAGYLPFDDDPANPEGDNINLLYKYIVNTPLTFPEYVTPHARDLLRRILVPSPRKRADLFEVARHSWLSEYAHVVEFITSSTTTSNEIQNTTVPSEEDADVGNLARSASVREASKTKQSNAAPSDPARKQGKADAEEPTYGKQKDNKRRTVQVEYVAPVTQTQRGEPSDVHSSPRGKTRARSSSQGPVEVHSSTAEKPLPRDPPVSKDDYATPSRDPRKQPSTHRRDAPPPRSNIPRTASDNAYVSNAVAGTSATRPTTGGSMQSTASRLASSTRGSYGQPLPPAVAGTNAHGSIQQPKGSKNYVISNPIPQESPDMDFGRPSISVPSKFAQVSGFTQGQQQQQQGEAKGHRRSNTIGEIGGKIFGRSGSIFGSRKKQRPDQGDKSSRKYPPVSMSNVVPGDSRTSMESRASRRSFSLGLGRKRSGSIAGSQASLEKPQNHRFSFMRAIGLSKEPATPPLEDSQQDLPIQEPPEVNEYNQYVESQHSYTSTGQRYGDGTYESLHSPRTESVRGDQNSTPSQSRVPSNTRPTAIPSYLQQGAVLNSESESSIENPQRKPQNTSPYQVGYDSDPYNARQSGRGSGRGGVLQKNRRFVDAYDGEEYGRPHDHAGSSGAAKRVMDFFRRRGRARGGES
ncbi:uncharacterized protein F4812DRAFT_452992 [Daldinia caldariorum]|uniref:uncharacterized protein n=1 Tax=Daldinia caldariorum TaxID=326644 RepID=UPI002008661E|nr:uncharacterized protein F4812DRAFT_452992 [Daldinia caldariorum]KAI1464400.1 hypothetical protein F4812DRAFT_452992 [Daldinia caldariorum]